jgi:hypothetical protein
MVLEKKAWELGEAELDEQGLPIIHDIVSKLGCIQHRTGAHPWRADNVAKGCPESTDPENFPFTNTAVLQPPAFLPNTSVGFQTESALPWSGGGSFLKMTDLFSMDEAFGSPPLSARDNHFDVPDFDFLNPMDDMDVGNCRRSSLDGAAGELLDPATSPGLPTHIQPVYKVPDASSAPPEHPTEKSSCGYCQRTFARSDGLTRHIDHNVCRWKKKRTHPIRVV